MKKHNLNILPDIKGEEFSRLESDLVNKGYNKKLPIFLYEGAILDGWQRYNICKNHNIDPTYEDFIGTKQEAMDFVLQTNKRRSLTSSQWAAIANEATDLINEWEREAKERIKERKGNQSGNKGIFKNNNKDVEKPEPIHTHKKMAQMFNTNPTYVQEAKRIKMEYPEKFEEIKSGKKTIPEIKRETYNETIQKPESYEPFFYETSKLLGRAGDHVERILQKDYIPKTIKDFVMIDSINNELYRLVRLAGQAGVNIFEVWDKMAARHGQQIQVPEHLKRPKNIKNMSIDEVEVID